jgi:DNA-binding GntR family transcriptional regulator
MAEPSLPSPHPHRLVRSTVVDMVVDDLRRRILSGELAPGTPLRQEALAEELGVSRIPLREAIRLLSSEGLVDLQPHRGAFVVPVLIEDVKEFFELRGQLEPWLLRLAVPEQTEADLAQAEDLVAAMEDADAGAWSGLNWRLHAALYRAANRPFAMNLVRTLHEKSGRYLDGRIISAPQRIQARCEHLALIALCRRGDATAAALELERHIADTTSQVISLQR